MDVAVIGATGDVGPAVCADLIARRVLRSTSRLQLVGRIGGRTPPRSSRPPPTGSPRRACSTGWDRAPSPCGCPTTCRASRRARTPSTGCWAVPCAHCGRRSCGLSKTSGRAGSTRHGAPESRARTNSPSSRPCVREDICTREGESGPAVLPSAEVRPNAAATAGPSRPTPRLPTRICGPAGAGGRVAACSWPTRSPSRRCSARPDVSTSAAADCRRPRMLPVAGSSSGSRRLRPRSHRQ